MTTLDSYDDRDRARGRPSHDRRQKPVLRARKPRVAVLVYNDCHADTRVLKTAATLVEAGADVRIFAIARPGAGYPVGVWRLASGVVLERLPTFHLGTHLEPLARVYRRLAGAPAPVVPRATEDVGRGRGASGGGTPARTGAAVLTVAAVPSVPKRSLPDRVLRSRAGRLALRPLSAVVLWSYWRSAADAVTQWRPDVVHANDANTLQPAMVAASRVQVPFVYDSHELWTQRNVAGRRLVATQVERWIERQGVRRAAAVITVSPSIATYLQSTYGLEQAPVLVRNVPPAAQRTTDRTEGRLRRLAGLADEARVIAYGGRITMNRGLEETIDALGELPADVHLVVLGYGVAGYVDGLRTRAREAGVAERVHFVGKVPSNEVSLALADADASIVFVRPTCLSYRWSLPNKLFESIHGGLPIVAADLPDTRQIVEEHGVGEVFESSHPLVMAQTILRVIDDPERYRAASRHAATQLTWEGESVHLLEVYRRALGDPWNDALADLEPVDEPQATRHADKIAS
ncbi:glycosyltransferase [Sanguibacter antarcticus]|uniref:Glycosyltransferase involved in cell wall biosynthesis n=1 Tax=Sanguibacter antarcticus TaxID=372484 RepID=A0A2A9E0N8_9MICO|nr:glycosyltransferase [Sanguibacter antarcticus]PFG32508.1 glycosyltransferase involved in cell wall biosynthesis [Sanguibacter antarcticus]